MFLVSKLLLLLLVHKGEIMTCIYSYGHKSELYYSVLFVSILQLSQLRLLLVLLTSALLWVVIFMCSLADSEREKVCI